ncbi:MAG: ATP-binding protein [Acidobacteria bacterium]|nr:ATP-binding protein [Acidobacteriota bacterium]
MVDERTFPKALASLDGIFAHLESFYRSELIDARTSLSLSLVVEEIFTNLVRYNTVSRNPIVLRIEREGDQVRLELVDHDVDRFDPSTLPEVNVDAPMAERKPGGLGLHLVRAIVDHISFEYENRVMRIAVVKNLERGHV